MPLNKTQQKAFNSLINRMANDYELKTDESSLIIEKAFKGGEFKELDQAEQWYRDIFKPNVVIINEDEYAKMCIDALKTVQTTVASYFGGSRQRDLGQLWGDMIRGYLGEVAFKKLLLNRWGIDSKLAHEKGKIEDFLDSDIPEVKLPNENWRKAKVNIGIKTTKMRGIWLDIPGDQFNHSNYHVLAKVSVGRDHLFGFFKKISVFKDKILALGLNIGALNQNEFDSLFNFLPDYRPIFAQVCGFVDASKSFSDLPYEGKKGRIHYKVYSWNGPYYHGDFTRVKDKEGLSSNGKVSLLGLESVTNQSRYLFNAGKLEWSDSAWKKLINKI